jgi:hypothetical protein
MPCRLTDTTNYKAAGGNPMLDWFSETVLKIVTSVPAQFVAEDYREALDLEAVGTLFAKER